MIYPPDLIIAHRGESFIAPENSLSAIKKAWDNGARAVEIDVHLTADNNIVVIHDFDTLRVSGEKKIIRETILKDLRNLSIGFYMGDKWKNERIPLLSEVLETIPGEGKILIEIKSDGSILEKLKVVLSQSKLRDSQIEIIAFDLKTLGLAKKLMPAYKMLWILDLDYSWPYWLVRINKKKIIGRILSLDLDGVDAWAGKILDKNFIDELKMNELLVYCWTVNIPEKAKQMIDCGIDGITTDRAEWMMHRLNEL